MARYLRLELATSPLQSAIAAFVVLAPASTWAQGTEGAIGAAFDDVLRRIVLFISGGVGLLLVMIASTTRRRAMLGITLLVGLVIAVAAAVIALHYGSWLTVAPLDKTQERFVPEFVGKLVWSIVTGIIALTGVAISLVRLRAVAPGHRIVRLGASREDLPVSGARPRSRGASKIRGILADRRGSPAEYPLEPGVMGGHGDCWGRPHEETRFAVGLPDARVLRR
jgi:hypothetical protein